MSKIEQSLELLGLKVRDKVSGLEGVVTSISFDMVGCIQGLVQPEANESKLTERWWIDVQGLDVMDILAGPVIPISTFSTDSGGVDKPDMSRNQ